MALSPEIGCRFVHSTTTCHCSRNVFQKAISMPDVVQALPSGFASKEGRIVSYLRAGDGNAPLSMQRRKRTHEPYNTAFLLQECRKAVHLKKDQHARADRAPRRGENQCPALLACSIHVHDAAQQQAKPFSSCLFSQRPWYSRFFATLIG